LGMTAVVVVVVPPLSMGIGGGAFVDLTDVV
jgi:hypothetical protein